MSDAAAGAGGEAGAGGSAPVVDEAKWEELGNKSKELGLFYGAVHDRNVKSFRLLNRVTLPVKYSDSFYRSLLDTPDEVTQMVYFRDVFVGGIGCRVENIEDSTTDKKLYIMTLGVLAPYRGQGIGACLVHRVLEATRLPKFENVKYIYLHVHTANEAAIRFYGRFGFVISDTIKNYYKRVDPPDCYILRRELGPHTFPPKKAEEETAATDA